MNREEEEKIIDECLAKLGEHFEAVQILATYDEPERQTGMYARGVGNWYSRIGMAREFLVSDQSRTIAHETKLAFPKDEDFP